MPLNLRLNIKGKNIGMSILAIIGLISTTILWILVILLHPIARVAGFLWLGIGLFVYSLYRKSINRPIVDKKTEAQLVTPQAYKMHVLLLVRPLEELETVKKSILENLDTRFVIRLLSVIDPYKFGIKATIEELEHIKEQTQKELETLAQELRSIGYETYSSVIIGELLKHVEMEAIKNHVDAVAIIKRTAEKASIEKGPEDELLQQLLKKKIITIIVKRSI